jgi:hypothetical protein
MACPTPRNRADARDRREGVCPAPFGESALTVTNGKHRLSHRLRAEGRYEEALELMEQVLAQRTERYEPDHRKTHQAKLALAVTLSKLERPAETSDVLSHLIPVCARA